MVDERSTVELTPDQRQLLAEVLEGIGSTENFDYRESPKARRDTIRAILDKLGIRLS